MPDAIPISENLFRDFSDETLLAITGTDVAIDDDLVDDERDLVIRCYELSVTGTLSLPGRSVSIFARRIHCFDQAAIDVSGGAGDPDYEGRPRAKDGQSNGAHGSRGANGGEGMPGGRIVIVADSLEGELQLIANGGAGGAAQNGGNGASGKHGAHGQKNSGSRKKANGGNGGRGGNAGAAGTPGKGGDGGQIEVRLRDELSQGQLTTQTDAGPAGAPAKHGGPGNGGAGGRAGSWREYEPIDRY